MKLKLKDNKLTMSRAEKFIHERTQYCSNEIIWNEKDETFHEYKPWIYPDDADSAVEIAREEIYEWLRKKHEDYLYKASYSYFNIEQCIDDLKQAMKDG